VPYSKAMDLVKRNRSLKIFVHTLTAFQCRLIKDHCLRSSTEHQLCLCCWSVLTN